MTVQPTSAELEGLLEAIQTRGSEGGTLLVRLRKDGGWEVKDPAKQATVSVTQADMDMATKALAIGSDLRREWQLAVLFAEHRESLLRRQLEESARLGRGRGEQTCCLDLGEGTAPSVRRGWVAKRRKGRPRIDRRSDG